MKNAPQLNWISHLEKRQRLQMEHPLRYLFLEVTRRCNLECSYCGSSCQPGAKTAEMTTDQWMTIIDQIADDFEPEQIMVAVTGGEPLIRKDIYQLLGYLGESGFRFGIVSNGAFINSLTAPKLVETGIGSISLSMDGPPLINDLVRGAGTSAQVENAIRALRNAGYTGVLEIISTITKPAVAHLDAMRSYVSSLRVSRWRVAPVMPIGRAAETPELLLSPQDIRTVLDFVKAGQGDSLLPHPEMSEEGYLGEEYEGQVRPYLCQCNAGITIGGILYDGRIGACPELADSFTQGHIEHDRFKDVWEQRYTKLRDRSWTHKGACASCDSFNRCQGGALHLYQDDKSELMRCFHDMLAPNQRATGN